MTDKPKPHTNQGHADPDKGGRDHYKRHVDGDITIRGQIETRVPPDAARQHNTEREADERRAKKNYVVGLLTLIAVILYASISFWQAWITQKQLRQTHADFVADERAWVGVEKLVMVKYDTENRDVGINYHNYGKSPAIHVRPVVLPWVVPKDETPDINGMLSGMKPFSDVLIMPGDGFGGHAIQQPSVEELKDVANHRKTLWVFGDIRYSDVFGCEHTTRFCAYYEPSDNTFGKCYHNNYTSEDGCPTK